LLNTELPFCASALPFLPAENTLKSLLRLNIFSEKSTLKTKNNQSTDPIIPKYVYRFLRI
ncbi:MAG: hypothetical protein ACYSRQ_02810, partial [Planctomycetota bacterium]